MRYQRIASRLRDTSEPSERLVTGLGQDRDRQALPSKQTYISYTPPSGVRTSRSPLSHRSHDILCILYLPASNMSSPIKHLNVGVVLFPIALPLESVYITTHGSE